jgi:hypothetical protein
MCVPMPGGGEIRRSAGLGRDWERDKPDRGRLFASFTFAVPHICEGKLTSLSV